VHAENGCLDVQDSAKSEWSSPSTVSSVIGSAPFGVFHSGEVSLGGKKNSWMDVVPPASVDMVFFGEVF
jgi:hypothetical protein